MGETHRVYLALGANLGNRAEQLREALNHLGAWGTVERISRWYETTPWGNAEQPDFLNLACLFITGLSPDGLLKNIKRVEEKMGRQSSFRNAPRPIDIDILIFDNLLLDSPELTVPHPRMGERAFVLAPMADIAPELVHPVLRLTVREMLERVGSRGVKPYPQAEVVESFYLETRDRLYFSVKGMEHPPDRWIAVLRYAPDPGGDRAKNGEVYRRLYGFSEQEQFIKTHCPQYLASDPFFQTTLQSVPRSLVREIHDPRQRLRDLICASSLKAIEKDAVAFAALLRKEAGVPGFSLGVSGSLLIGMDAASSDLDISVFGKQNCHRAHQALHRLLSRQPSGDLSRLDRSDMDQLYLERSADTNMDLEEFLRLQRRKVNQGRFRDRVYFVRFVKEAHEAAEIYGQLRYTPMGRAEIRATVVDDRESIFTPCRYAVSEARDPGGRQLEDLTEVVSFRARFCEQVKAGESVEASGMLEQVQTKSGRSWQRLLLGRGIGGLTTVRYT